MINNILIKFSIVAVHAMKVNGDIHCIDHIFKKYFLLCLTKEKSPTDWVSKRFLFCVNSPFTVSHSISVPENVVNPKAC